ncbi:TniQ family protein [Leisingera aquimarina]|uniref:TniQ family protein n=1 Tax=Leisingera aquimarina TaxID=476529 RepID=UPI00042173CD|nr:TniQ family protein [Leisingera aquimarina]
MKLRSTTPEDCESLLGFLRRIAAMNAYDHLGDFLSLAEVRYGRPMLEDLSGLAEKLGVSASALERIAPQANPDFAALDWRFQRNEADPFCPACIQDGNAWKQSWRHCLVSACSEHGLALQSWCPRCCVTLSPTKGGFRTCECGYRLQDFQRIEATAGEVHVARLIEAAGRESLDAHIGPWETDVPSSISRFLFFLATSDHSTRSDKPGKVALPRTLEATRDFMAPVHDLLADWPHAFDLNVEKRLNSGPQEFNSAPARLGKWYQRLMSFRGAAFGPFQERVGKTVGRVFDGAYPGALTPDEGRDWISAAKATKLLRVRAERLVSAVSEGVVKGRLHHSGHGHRHTTIPMDEVDRLRDLRARYVSSKDAGEFLGVAKKQFSLLIECGFIQTASEEAKHPLVDGSVDLHALIALVDGIRDEIAPAPPNGRQVRFRDLNLRRTTDRKALFQLLRQIRDGQIRPVAASKDDPLADFAFCVEEVDRFIKGVSGPAPLTARDVAELTGWKHECVTHWCNEGLLKSSHGRRGGADTYFIRHQDLVEFQKKFVVVSDVARELGSLSKHIISRASDGGTQTTGSKLSGSASRCHLLKISTLVS